MHGNELISRGFLISNPCNGDLFGDFHDMAAPYCCVLYPT